MAKQKATAKMRVLKALEKNPRHQLHTRRAWWFGVLAIGMLVIQFAYNLHSPGRSPQVLGYATTMSNEVLLSNTNDYRAKAGLPKLKLNDDLSHAAQAKANDMIAHNYWSHISPDGTTPWTYFQKFHYSYSGAGENLAYGFATSEQVVSAWMNSAEHRANVMGNFADIGFGFANGKDYQHGNNTVVVAFYGLPEDQDPHVAGASTSEAYRTGPGAKERTSFAPTYINGITSIVSGNAPWASYASLALVGAAVMGFLVTHLETLKLGWHNAKKYAVLHPIVDAAVLFCLALIIVQAAGGFVL